MKNIVVSIACKESFCYECYLRNGMSVDIFYCTAFRKYLKQKKPGSFETFRTPECIDAEYEPVLNHLSLEQQHQVNPAGGSFESIKSTLGAFSEEDWDGFGFETWLQGFRYGV